MVVVGLAVVVGVPPRPVTSPPTGRAAPSFSRNDSGTPLPTEAEAWGEIWSHTNGAAVLRPTWLPKGSDEYQIFSGEGTGRDGLFGYSLGYVEQHAIPGTTVWNIEFLADSRDHPSRGVQEFGGASQDVKVRGHAGELFGNGAPGWTLVWTEGTYRYAIQAFGVSRDDVLRIADTLAPVTDASGRTTPAR